MPFKKCSHSLLFLILLITQKALANDTLIEAKGAYFYPTSSSFRDIYSEGPLFSLETSVRTWNSLYTWASLGIFTKEGHSVGLHDRTRIAFYPFGAGIKYLYPIKFMDFYAGIGALGTYMHIHDHGFGIRHKICRWGGGGIAKAGIILNATKHLFLDIFTDYSVLYVPIAKSSQTSTQNANLSGWSIGAAIGYRFGSKCSKPQEGGSNE